MTKMKKICILLAAAMLLPLLAAAAPARQADSGDIASMGDMVFTPVFSSEAEGTVYTNSPLVDYTRISPNKTAGRTHAIDTITIHCVVGQCSVETLGAVFAPTSKKASSNYGIGFDGRVGMYVEEKDRSWCTSSPYNDNRAVTIEVASDTYEPLAVRKAAYDKLIVLVTDICQRNGIEQLKWSTDKVQRMNHLHGCNMTVHRDYADKSCPGTYLYERMGQIAAAVNANLRAARQASSASVSANR